MLGTELLPGRDLMRDINVVPFKANMDERHETDVDASIRDVP